MITSLRMWMGQNAMRLALSVPSVSRSVHLTPLLHVCISDMKASKACSSAQRKEAFKSIQYHHKEHPLQLLLDMKVRWSSTFVMLTHVESQRQVYTSHIFAIVLTGCAGSWWVCLWTQAQGKQPQKEVQDNLVGLTQWWMDACPVIL